MNVSLTPELEAFVHQKVESGLYNSASEVIRESLTLLRENERLREWSDEDFRSEIMEGIEDLRAGRLRIVETEEDRATLIAEIKHRGRQLAKERLERILTDA